MSHITKPISQQVIFITGASSGIGLATAKMAAEKGAKVVMVSRNLPELKRICQEITENGGDVTCVKADVANFAQLQKAKEKALAAYGRIDTWINNAGTAIYGKLIDLDIVEEKRLFDVNFWGIRHGCHLAVEALQEQGGVLINLGSEVSNRSVPLLGIYSATKQAVKAYTDALRIELMDDKLPIHVCLIRPTAINTPFADHAVNRLRSGTPKLPGDVYDPNLVAEAILECAVNPQRDIFVGGPAKVTSLMESVSPSLTDQVQLASINDQIGRRKHLPEQESLFSPPANEGIIHGKTPISEEKHHSLYTTLTSRPVVSFVTLAVASAVSLASWMNKKDE